MKNLRLTIAIALTIVSLSTLKAQNLGITVNRGISTLCPDFKNFSSTISQGYGFGFYKYQPLKNNFYLRTGVNITSINSCKSILTSEGTHSLIPQKYTYAHLPIAIEKQFFKYDKISRKVKHYTWSLGADFAYLVHENGFEQHVGDGFRTNPLNMGATASIQMIKPMARDAAFGFGPQIQAFSTGQDVATVAVYAGVRLDWKIGKYNKKATK